MVTRCSKEPGKCLAILGTASDVGKSVVVTALCRVFGDLGIHVSPFKAQNMSNNSFVTSDGGEIGRAQVAQAEAARLEPHVDMNPVLLKPNSDLGAQVVLHGKPLITSSALEYGKMTEKLKEQAASSLGRLRQKYDLIVMEGAGSCAEINLKDRDFVNLPMAQIADAPVVLVADIDRGGVFAQIVGTLEILSREERDRIKGVIINRFRGDPVLFEDGISYLENRTGIPVLGVVPYIHDIGVDSEDAVVLEPRNTASTGPVHDKVNIAVLKFPHISNFTDFSPLEREPTVKLDYLSNPCSLIGYDLVILPGTKNVRGDLLWLRKVGFESRLREYLDIEGRVGGICGGYQMLGEIIEDPHGVEGYPGSTRGLQMLDVTTTLLGDKVLTRTEGFWIQGGEKLSGYEIHQGRTVRQDHVRAAVRFVSQNGMCLEDLDGARSENGRVFGTYLHGLFDEPAFMCSLLAGLRPDLADRIEDEQAETAAKFRDRQYDRLADCFRSCVDTDAILRILGHLQ
ncbi:MAG: cobyric acid synthase [Deltaproteobacteria bacterium]|nr:cobyric acid synthase [Deltaproteobacteria bacterium]